MDLKTILAVFATLAMFALWLWLRRLNRGIEQRPDYPYIRMWMATLMVAMMIGMSIAFPEMWGPVGGWTWTCMLAFVVVAITVQWRRVLTGNAGSRKAVKPAVNPPIPPGKSN